MQTRRYEIHWVTRAAFFCLGLILLLPVFLALRSGIAPDVQGWLAVTLALAALIVFGLGGSLALRTAYRGTLPVSLINGTLFYKIRIRSFGNKTLIAYLFITVAIVVLALENRSVLAFLAMWSCFALAGPREESVSQTVDGDVEDLILRARSLASSMEWPLLLSAFFLHDSKYLSLIVVLACPVLLMVAGARWLADFEARRQAQISPTR